VSDAERFWSKVDRGADPAGCWIWTAAKHRNGYGAFGTWDGRSRKAHRAHRYAFELAFGAIEPASLFVCHRCDNPSCVNPSHLFLGTALDNAQDREAKGRGPGPKVRGERHGAAKLSPADVYAIRARSTEMLKVLAQEFGVSTEMVYRIRHRKAWAHLPEVQP
jgi:hypothetical protein